MSSPGKFIFDTFNGQAIDIFVSNFNGQMIEYSQISVENKYIIHGKVTNYYEKYDILELENHENKKFFIHSDNIDMFWLSGTLNIIESIGCMIPSLSLKKDV